MESQELPSYVPLDVNSAEFRKLRSYHLPDEELKKTGEDILNSAKEYLDGIIEEEFSSNTVRDDGELNRLEPIKTLIDAYEKLIFTRLKSQAFNRAFEQSKEDIVSRAATEEPLNVRNLSHYATISSQTKNLAELIEEGTEQAAHSISDKTKRKYLESHPDYKYLKNATIIIDDPLQPLPNDDGEDDDDLEMAGGKVDIKCPVTLKSFENPYISQKCQHVFDLEAINILWRGNSPVGCPVPGCRQQLTKNDFIQDRIMSLRVKAWARLEVKKERHQNYEKI